MNKEIIQWIYVIVGLPIALYLAYIRGKQREEEWKEDPSRKKRYLLIGLISCGLGLLFPIILFIYFSLRR